MDRERLALMATGRKRSGKPQDGLGGLGLFEVTLEQAIEQAKRAQAEEGRGDDQ
jgi:hypothetical protein